MQWQVSQIKTFTRWINGYVSKRGLKIESLEKDLRDGVVLINLLEILTGKTIEKYYKAPKSRTYMIANNTIALAFMGQYKICNTCSCSPQDLTDGRIRMIMGLIWSLIRQFSMKTSGKHLLSKNELIAWCKSMVEGYRNIRFDGSTHCFQDGLIFCALINKYDPSLFDYDSLDFNDPVGNLRTVFTIAESTLNMPRLEHRDLNEDFLDERTLYIYLAEFYNIFQQRKVDSLKSPRVDQERELNLETDMVIEKDSGSQLDIVKVAEKYFSTQEPAPISSERMKAEIEQLHIQIVHLTEEYETRITEEREGSQKDIQIREETIASMERKIEELEKQQQSQHLEFDRAAQEEWNFIMEQKRIINNEKLKIEADKKKIAEEQDLIQKARQNIRKQKNTIIVERQKFDKEKLALLVGDLKLIDFQGREVASQIEFMRRELRQAKLAIERLQTNELDLSYLGESEFLDESEDMDYYSDSWWEVQRSEMAREEDLKLRRVVLLQRKIRAWLSKKRQERKAHALAVIKRALRAWRAKRLRTMILRYKPRISAVIISQSAVKRWIARRAYKMLQKRATIAREVLATEKTYVTSLELVVKVFIEPMKNMSLLTKEQMRAVFSEIEVILAYNRMLLNNLQKRMETWNVATKIGDIFMKMTDFLKVYTQYVNNYDSAITTINAIKHNDKVDSFLLKCNNDPRCRGLDIGAFLILPIQRIPRYVLLLQDLFKSTPPNHSDYEDLHVSLWKMKHVADYVNDKKKDADNIHEVLSVQDKLVKLEQDLVLAQPHRRYLREGYLVDMKEKRKVFCFLFNDLLIGAKKKAKTTTKKKGIDTFKFLYKIPLTEATVITMNTNGKIPSFRITNGQAYTFYAVSTAGSHSQEETMQWFFEIQGAIEKLGNTMRVRTNSTPEPTTSPSSSSSSSTPSMRTSAHRHSIHLYSTKE